MLISNSLNRVFIFMAEMSFTDVDYNINFDLNIIANVSCTIMFLA